jgi:hypothetical protein
VLKRQNRRLYLVAFMDDHSRFITGFGLHASQSAALVLEVLRAALASYSPPREILTDNGAQYVTWRGKSQFTRELRMKDTHTPYVLPILRPSVVAGCNAGLRSETRELSSVSVWILSPFDLVQQCVHAYTYRWSK